MTYHFTVGEDGRTLVLPADLAISLGLRAGASLEAEVDGATLRMTATPDDSLARLRKVMEGYTLGEFLADRRRDGQA